MEKDLGPEAKLKAEIVDGKVKLGVVYVGAQVSGDASVSTSADALCDALAALWPGDSAIESGVIGLLRGALKSIIV